MRQIINKYGVYIAAAAVLLAAIPVYLYFRGGPSASASNATVFFVDEETNEEFVRPATDVPPLPGKSGRLTLVRAIKVSCDGGRTSRIAYLEKYTEDAKSKLETLPPNDAQRNSLLQDGLLVRLPDAGSPWVSANDSAGESIRENVPCPDGGTLTIVLPPSK